jgi:Rha family phage regulatory protein
MIMTTELVFMGESGQAITNSLLVAKKFGKDHKHVLESIRKLMTAENSAVLQMFEESTYINEQNKTQPMYLMNRDGFTLLAMGFTGTKAMEFKIDYINAFNKMESKIKKSIALLPDFTDPAAAAEAWAKEYKEKKVLAIENK